MINIDLLRNNNSFIVKNLLRRGYNYKIDFFINLDKKIRAIKTDISNLRCNYKLKSLIIGKLKFKKNNEDNIDIEKIKSDINLIKKEIKDKKDELEKNEIEFKLFMLSIPNLLSDTVPNGNNSDDNLEIRNYKRIYKINNISSTSSLFSSEYIDFNISANLSGSGFVLLKKDIAQLHRALGNYMLDIHINSGYEEIYSPLMVNEKSMLSTGHFPKFKDEQFKIENLDLWLIPTSEVVLANIVSGKILDINKLPLKYVSKTSCFRKEKGNYGKMVKGMIRQHQFEKVELVHIVEASKSYESLETLVINVENLLKKLDLTYRVMSLCSKETGFSSSKTYDLEVLFPIRKEYIEVSSCSNTESFQSIRMNARYKNSSINKYEYVHILNGSGTAIGRILIAIIENYLDYNGRIIIPEVLLKYMNGIKFIEGIFK